MKFNKICVIGLGYIGLPTASTFATHGTKVVGVDINSEVVKSLQKGHLHIYEPGLQKLLQDSLQNGNLLVRDAPEEADAYIIAVPTPFYDDKKADMRAVVSAAESIVPFLRPKNLVVLESTSPPRTTVDILIPILEKSGLTAGKDFHLAYSPERVLPGKILQELVENARVIGGVTPESAEAGRDLYQMFVKGEIITTDATTAEMVKLMENTYRDVNIAIANEFSRLADRFGIDIWQAIQIANLHPRVKILNPGPGVGGHCISVDPWFLVEAAPDITPLISASRHVNDSQPGFVLQLVRRILGKDLRGKRVAVLGLTYKPDVDDFRESPSIEVAHLLKQEGCQVLAYDPFLPMHPVDGLQISNDVFQTVQEAELLVFLVSHKELKKVLPHEVKEHTEARLVLDTVNILDRQAWQEEGFKIYRLGDHKNE